VSVPAACKPGLTSSMVGLTKANLLNGRPPSFATSAIRLHLVALGGKECLSPCPLMVRKHFLDAASNPTCVFVHAVRWHE